MEEHCVGGGNSRVVQSDGLGFLRTDVGAGLGAAGGGGGVPFNVKVIADNGSGLGVDLVVVLLVPAPEIHVVHGPAVVILKLAAHEGGLRGGDAGVAQGDLFGLGLADIRAGVGVSVGRAAVRSSGLSPGGSGENDRLGAVVPGYIQTQGLADGGHGQIGGAVDGEGLHLIAVGVPQVHCLSVQGDLHIGVIQLGDPGARGRQGGEGQNAHKQSEGRAAGDPGFPILFHIQFLLSFCGSDFVRSTM